MVGRACSTCGVTAIGSCHRCLGAFCLSHQGRDDVYHRPYSDLCLACSVKEQDERHQRQLDADAELQRLRERIPVLIKALQAAAIEPTRRTWPDGQQKRFLRGWETKYRDEEPAWPAAELEWRWSEARMYGSGSEERLSGVTASGKVVPMQWAHPPSEELSNWSTGVRRVVEGLERTLVQAGVSLPA